ncbi:MAG: galactose-binding domain-containing protein [Phycisphaerales bacterium]
MKSPISTVQWRLFHPAVEFGVSYSCLKTCVVTSRGGSAALRSCLKRIRGEIMTSRTIRNGLLMMIGIAAFAIIAEAASNHSASVPDVASARAADNSPISSDSAYTYPETIDASVPAPDATVVTALLDIAPTYVSTFECIGLYWSPDAPADQVCTVQYRIAGLGGVWNNAMNLWYDARALNGRPAEYRGSIVGLIPGASYEVRVTLADGTTSTITATTMSETFPVGTTVLLPTTSTSSLAITTGGTANAYKLYTFDPANGSATIDVQKAANNCITVSAPYVIIRGLTLKGAKVHGIDLANGAHHVVIENNDISDWGSPVVDGVKATDGSKASNNYTQIPMGGSQWVQVDLGASYNLTKVNMWHFWPDGRTYHDVIVQLSNDATFATGVTTVYNNDTDNSSGQGVGTDTEYAETSTGKTVTFAAVNARYVRYRVNRYTLTTGGTGAYAHFCEVEAYADTTNLAAGILPTFSYGTGLGVSFQSAVHGAYHNPTITDIVVQRNKMRDPTYTTNSWDYGHPAGPQGITFEQDGGGHNIFRYNEITTSNGHFYNDAIGGGENFSLGGVPGSDSDVYGNIATHCYDDGLEIEGGGMNVRVWGNYVDQTATGISSACVAMGPLYIFRNVYNTSRHLYNRTLDTDDRLGFGKAGDGTTYGGGRRYSLHNTLLQQPQDGGTYPLGAGGGLDQSGGPLTNSVTRNNIFHIWKSWWASINDTRASTTNDFDYDLYNGVITAYAGAEPNGIHNTPIYASGNGWVSGSGGLYALDPSSPGYHVAVPLANFNDSTATPDMGAHQSGTPPMEFGVNIVRNMVNDGDMSMADTSLWPNMFSPTVKEKVEFDGNRRIHIIGNYPSGAQQSVTGYIPGVTYKYSISVYLVSGTCKAQIYQGQQGYIKDLYSFNTPTGTWRTFTGTYTAGVGAGYLIIRFYGYDTTGPSEFYVDNISLTPN